MKKNLMNIWNALSNDCVTTISKLPQFMMILLTVECGWWWWWWCM